MKSRLFPLLIYVLILLTLLVSCQNQNPTNETTEEYDFVDDLDDVEKNSIEVDRGYDVLEGEFEVIVTGTEGEMIKLDPKAFDPDGDDVTFYFSEPFNKKGMWQTRIGDAGEYPIFVTASDSMDETTQQVLVKVHKANMKPIMNCPKRIIVTEGELLVVNCDIKDPEGDPINVRYSGFIGESSYIVTFDDAGTHKIYVHAWDSGREKDKVTQEITLVVNNLNRKPEVVFNVKEPIVVTEEDVITLTPTVHDPDGDKITVEYSKPIGRDGVWKTRIGDAGEYDVIVSVNDGENIVKKIFHIVVERKNTPPVILVGDGSGEISVLEGQKIDLDIKIEDRDGDDVKVTISGFMNKEEYTTTYDDAQPKGCDYKECTAKYEVKITADDGTYTISKEIIVKVTDRNRPPVFKVPA